MDTQNIRLFSGSSSRDLAALVSEQTWIELSKCEVKRFSCWEIYVRFEETVRWREVFIIQTIREWSVNEDLMELFFLIDAAKQSFAKTIHLIVPHMAYSRQDKIHKPREWISAKLIAKLIESAWANEVITVNLHSDQHQGFFNIPVDNINMRRLFIEEVRNLNLQSQVIVTPDTWWTKNAKAYADALWCPLAILHKVRPDHNLTQVTHIIWDVKNKTPIIVDDMIDTAWSVCWTKKALIDAGANNEVYLVSTHAVFSWPAIDRLKEADFKKIIVSDTLPLEERKRLPNVKIVSCSSLISKVIVSTIERTSASMHY